jgi:hypothetical protein
MDDSADGAIYPEKDLVLQATGRVGVGITVLHAPIEALVSEAFLQDRRLIPDRIEVREGEFVIHAEEGDWTYRYLGKAATVGVLRFRRVAVP